MAYWLDEGWHNWPEIMEVGTAAAGLYSRCGSYIADRQTDGLIPAAVVRMYGTAEWSARLVAVGLWSEVEGGYRDERYFPLNATKADIETRKSAAAMRQRKYQHGKKRGSTSKKADASLTRESHVSDALLTRPPIPSSPSEKGRGARPRSAQGAAHAPTEDPRVIAEEEERLRQQTEAAVTAIAEHQRRTQRGASVARAAIGGRRTPPPRRDALAELRALTTPAEEESTDAVG